LRAKQPEQKEYVDRAGGRVYYENFGADEPTFLLNRTRP
jgi:hypothetical protein